MQVPLFQIDKYKVVVGTITYIAVCLGEIKYKALQKKIITYVSQTLFHPSLDEFPK